MARLVGPDEAFRLSFTLPSDNRIGTAAGLPVVVYADAEATTLADILTLEGAPVPGSELEVQPDSLLPQFQFPDGVDTVYVKVGEDAQVYPVEARVKDQLLAQVEAVTADTEAALAGKQPTLPAGTTGQFLRGDQTFVAVTKTNVGLGNVDNTADSAKPVSTAQQTALDAKLTRTDVVKSGNNIALGATQPNVSGTDNVAIGQQAQNALTSGAANVAIGGRTQAALTSGAANVALGDGAQSKVTTSNFNTALGAAAQTNMTTGAANTAVGGNAQLSLTTGSNNTAVGQRAQYGPAGQQVNATTTASQQTAVGVESGQADATASTGITTVGYRAIAAGTGSTALGTTSTASGAASTALGPNTTASGANAVAVGSGVSAAAAGSVAIGKDSAGTAASSTTADEIVLGTWKHSIKAAVVNGTANVKAMRLPGDTDDTAAVLRAVASGAKRIHFPAGSYTVNVPQGGTLGSWTGVDGIHIDAGQATITNTATYARDAAFTSIFQFDGCKNIRVEVGRYSGQMLADPVNDFGYRGELLVRLINGCDRAVIRGTVANVRYAVQSGQYDDAGKGGCKNLDVQLRTFMAGYPLALYLAEGVRFDIDADDVHRGAYLGGCVDVRGVVRWKDQWGPADTVLLITDAMTGVGTSRGCKTLDVVSIDKGSTRFEPTTFCAAIMLSRVDPGTVYEDIKVRVFTKGANAISTTVGGFRIASGVTALGLPGYTTKNWDPSIVVRNVSVSGVVDHSGQTVAGNPAGNISVRMYDYLITTPTSYGTLENFVLEDLQIREPNAVLAEQYISSYLIAPLLGGRGATLRRVDADGTVFYHETNQTAPTTFESCKFRKLYQATSVAAGTGARSQVIDSTMAEYQNSLGEQHSLDVVNSSLNGGRAAIQQRSFIWNLSGASVALTNLVPANSMVLGVQGRLTQAITGATGFQVGVSGALTRYADVSATAAGTTFTVSNGTDTGPRLYTADTSLIVTAKGLNFTAGTIRVVVHYLAFGAPTA